MSCCFRGLGCCFGQRQAIQQLQKEQKDQIQLQFDQNKAMLQNLKAQTKAAQQTAQCLQQLLQTDKQILEKLATQEMRQSLTSPDSQAALRHILQWTAGSLWGVPPPLAQAASRL